MKAVSFYLMSAMIVATMTTSCSSDDYGGTDTPGTKAEIWASIQQETRAKDASWEAGDVIGVTVNGLADRFLNIPYKYTGDGQPFTPEGDAIYFLGTQDLPLTAYYPFQGNAGEAAGTISVDTRSAQQADDVQPKIDMMFASTTANRAESKATLLFSHSMSKLQLVVTDTDGQPRQATCSITGLIVDGTFSTADGTVTPGEQTYEAVVKSTDAQGSVTLLAVPQTASSVTIDVECEGIYYTASVDNITLNAAKAVTLTLKLNNSSTAPTITVESEGIKDWEEDVEGSGEIDLNKDNPEYKPDTDGGADWGSDNPDGEDINVEM